MLTRCHCNSCLGETPRTSVGYNLRKEYRPPLYTLKAGTFMRVIEMAHPSGKPVENLLMESENVTTVEDPVSSHTLSSEVRKRRPQKRIQPPIKKKHHKGSHSLLYLLVPHNFAFAESLCSYGYFTLPPNHWKPAPAEHHVDEGVLIRPLRFGPILEHAAVAEISMASCGNRIAIRVTQ